MKGNLWAIAVVSTGMILPQFGALDPALQKSSTWLGFHVEDPILTGIYAQRVPAEECETWVSALSEDRRGIIPVSLAAQAALQDWKNWLPLESIESNALEECDHFPCAFKLDESEVQRMKKAEKKKRLSVFLELVYDRAQDYSKTGVLRPFEFPGGVQDPWKLLEIHGFKSELRLPPQAELGLRVLDLHESRVRAIRQFTDRRVAVSPDHQRSSVWMRAFYMNHYFDSWGEWGSIQCSSDKRADGVLVLALSLELDLLKKTGFFASFGKSSMKSSIREAAGDYLRNWATALSVEASKEKRAK